MQNNATVLDAKGDIITRGSIVEIIPPPSGEREPFTGYRGAVMSPHVDSKEFPEYSVPVFFFREVPDYHFTITKEQQERLTWWKSEYREALREGDPSFLFNEKAH